MHSMVTAVVIANAEVDFVDLKPRAWAQLHESGQQEPVSVTQHGTV